MSQLIAASEDGTRLNDAELRATAGLVLAAGFETTVNLLGNGIRMLLDAPEHLDTLRERPDLWPNAVEEILRLDSPVQLTVRKALNDVELAGRQIKGGDVVLLYLAAANRDPSVFPDPHRFDRSCRDGNYVGCSTRSSAYQHPHADPIGATFERESGSPRRGGDSRWQLKPFRAALRLHHCRYPPAHPASCRWRFRASGRTSPQRRKRRSPERLRN